MPRRLAVREPVGRARACARLRPALVALSIALPACATPYQPNGALGGYRDIELREGAFQVTFQGNGFTSSQSAGHYVLLRCAELTLGCGARYFEVVEATNQVQQYIVQTPGYSVSNYSSVYGGGYGASRSSSYAVGPTASAVNMPFAQAVIQVVPQQTPSSLDAEVLARSIRSEYGIPMARDG